MKVIRSASASIVSETAAAAQEKDDPQAAVAAIAKSAAASVISASAAAAQKKDNPQAGRHTVSVVASASTVKSLMLNPPVRLLFTVLYYAGAGNVCLRDKTEIRRIF